MKKVRKWITLSEENAIKPKRHCYPTMFLSRNMLFGRVLKDYALRKKKTKCERITTLKQGA